jgi:hypothetical protein
MYCDGEDSLVALVPDELERAEELAETLAAPFALTFSELRTWFGNHRKWMGMRRSKQEVPADMIKTGVFTLTSDLQCSLVRLNRRVFSRGGQGPSPDSGRPLSECLAGLERTAERHYHPRTWRRVALFERRAGHDGWVPGEEVDVEAFVPRFEEIRRSSRICGGHYQRGRNVFRRTRLRGGVGSGRAR